MNTTSILDWILLAVVVATLVDGLLIMNRMSAKTYWMIRWAVVTRTSGAALLVLAKLCHASNESPLWIFLFGIFMQQLGERRFTDSTHKSCVPFIPKRCRDVRH